ncbi:RNA polymerase sigma factor, RpoD/SigA family [Aetokthonos hydrillicola Thurmond2011]|jgi:RNA polymerase nonessential primary-like sigma factor|uniref:RNA polymerase sigma factor, RpoD/SigA family n=1 Tax=Aetokthonos hydrillicola Thurmond2011 TaxID=2712845 RepID=A0AAP5IDP9_9CYAN|nr:RNA polymerase sigma factor, RpoD/SigA family [Aetokthonos hydrillicola]MBO3463647.1 RNA polymerase sigma factor, RpoD/SigA family [Aetokthonos hydrillicola CCALA 1050]MBW4590446.1 RNA polymerase sigma factor, RpoD/SigA family [Aetokthonos hydrillicola CCALA 1050]MDR9899726.1 RNA polymerase sigma factor, RpoD/SigA family [Aetokthonos hydrillicola Thurmond2011]
MPRVTSDLVRSYLQEIGRYPLLTPSEEISYAREVHQMVQIQQQQQAIAIELNRKPTEEECNDVLGKTSSEIQSILHQGQVAKNQMLNANLRLVVSVAKKYQNRNLEFLDLIQEGTLGLHRGIEKFDPNRGCRLSTYVYWWITQSITRAISEKSRTIRLPIHINEQLNQIKKIQREMSQSLGRKPTVAEIAESLLVTPEQVREYLQCSQRPTSLDMPVGDDKASVLGDLLPANQVLILDQLNQELVRQNLRELMESSLTSIQRQVITLRFGLEDDQQVTLMEIARRLKLSRERIRQIQCQAIKILRRQGSHLNN